MALLATPTGRVLAPNKSAKLALSLTSWVTPSISVKVWPLTRTTSRSSLLRPTKVPSRPDFCAKPLRVGVRLAVFTLVTVGTSEASKRTCNVWVTGMAALPSALRTPTVMVGSLPLSKAPTSAPGMLICHAPSATVVV